MTVRRLNKTLGPWFALALLALLGNAAISSWNVARLSENGGQVIHTLEVLTAIEQALRTLSDAETGQRGYVLTGDEGQFEAYRKAVDGTPQLLKRIRTLTTDSAVQQRRIGELERTANRKIVEMDRVVRVRQSSGLLKAAEIVSAGEGIAAMEEFRRIAAEMKNTEEEFLAIRNGQTKAALNRTSLTISFATIVAALLLASVFSLVRRDARERERNEVAARERETRYRFLADSMPQIVWTSTPGGHLDYFNHPWNAYTGLAGEGSVGQGWTAAIHTDDRARVEESWRHSLATGEPFEVEGRLRRSSDNSSRWHLARGLPRRDASGQIAQWVGTFTDIDDAKRAEQALREGERRFRLLIEAMPQLVWVTRPDGYHEYFNQRWYEYTGTSPGDTDGAAWSRLLHPDDLERSEERWRHCLRSAEPYSIEYRLRRGSDGTYRWFLGRAMPLRDEEGQISRWFGTCTDIDDQKRAEVRLRDINEELDRRVQERTTELQDSTNRLERSNRELQEFASVASHDLQEPLRKIQAFGDRLRSRYMDELGEQGRDYLARMLDSAGRMRTLIEDLLSFSRVTTKAQPFVPVDLAQVAREVSSDLEGRLQQVGGRIDLGELPTVAADPTQMRQLLQNLIGNGLKFRKPDIPPVVEVRSRTFDAVHEEGATNGHSGPTRVCEILVRDNGIGFEEKYLDRIFNVFQRLHGRNEYEGTGMGLAICRKIVERHAGHITARSGLGEGSTFVVTLPLSHDNNSEESP